MAPASRARRSLATSVGAKELDFTAPDAKMVIPYQIQTQILVTK